MHERLFEADKAGGDQVCKRNRDEKRRERSKDDCGSQQEKKHPQIHRIASDSEGTAGDQRRRFVRRLERSIRSPELQHCRAAYDDSPDNRQETDGMPRRRDDPHDRNAEVKAKLQNQRTEKIERRERALPDRPGTLIHVDLLSISLADSALLNQ